MSSVIHLPLQIRFGAIDSSGHVNNLQYRQFLADVRIGGFDCGFRALEQDNAKISSPAASGNGAVLQNSAVLQNREEPMLDGIGSWR